MSIKRQAPTELNHENWDQEDSKERDEFGMFKTASKEVLEKRIIRTAKRRSQVASDEPKKSVFSGFGGFNKTQQSSFDFLANLTNGSKLNNIQPTTKNDTVVSSSIFTNNTLSSGSNTGIFSMSGSSGFVAKPTLGKSSEGSLFGPSVASNTSPIQSVFTATKADSTVSDSPFKIQPSIATESITKPKVNQDASVPQVSSTIFGSQSNSNPSKSLFSSTPSNSTLFCAQAVSSTSAPPSNNTTTKADSNTTELGTKPIQKDEKRRTYLSKLRGLNESVSDWIKKHVEETPLCILSPIFKDYERYLKEIQEEYKGGENRVKNNETKAESKAPPETNSSSTTSNVNSSIFGNLTSSNVGKIESSQNNNFGNAPPSNVGKIEPAQNTNSDVSTKSSSFSFGITTATVTTANTGFSFGINPSTASTASSLFSINTSTTTNANTPFSFGINKSGFGFNTTSPKNETSEVAKDINTSTTTNASTPFSFGINKSGFGFNATSPPKTQTSEVAKDEDDEPPKVEFTPVVEKNSIYDIKCKIFIKKDGNFVDKGVGTLYIKKIEESDKHQLLVRANTNLGSVLLNLVLSSFVPTQRMGKNNVMVVCIPTPDSKPPPTPILIRVKTAEEADELLNMLNKYKA